MFAQSEAVLRLIRLTVTTQSVLGSMTAFGPAARKRGLHGPRPPQGTPTHVSGTLTILAVALGSCHALVAAASSTSIDSIFAGQLQLAAALGLAAQAAAPAPPRSQLTLTTDWAEEETAVVEGPAPHFRWVVPPLATREHGVTQASYRVQVRRVDGGGGNVTAAAWDSGVVSSNKHSRGSQLRA